MLESAVLNVLVRTAGLLLLRRAHPTSSWPYVQDSYRNAVGTPQMCARKVMGRDEGQRGPRSSDFQEAHGRSFSW